ncbi:MAG: hypothetical protein HKN12_07695, partial [Gemmatimonadetes bacterium]|nr:hypothetical protein [Gemmatimonadota bacterium]
WGDVRVQTAVAPDDGNVWAAVKVDSLGGGQWHYEYAVYNYTSDRGLQSFSVPTGAATITNVSFHDVDKDSLNDWTATVTPGLVTWETDDFATDPGANALVYGSMFNFRFDADAAPVASQIRAGIFKPGTGTEFFMNLTAPSSGAVSALVAAPDAPAFGLRAVEPNPFRQGTRVSFAAERARDARISVIDIAGREVRVLLDGRVPAGRSEATWDGLDTSGARAAAGIYFFRMESEGEGDTLKGILLR